MVDISILSCIDISTISHSDIKVVFTNLANYGVPSWRKDEAIDGISAAVSWL